MADTGYGKMQFERDLNALGAVPHGTPDALPELLQGHHRVVVADAAGRVCLLGTRAGYDLSHALSDGIKRLPAAYSYAAGALVSKIGNAPVVAYNPYALSVYLPDGNDGHGEAAHYILEEPIYRHVEEQCRIITEQEAVGRLLQDAHMVDDELGLFIPRVELECLYALSMPKNHSRLTREDEGAFQDFARTQLPSIRVSIDPYRMNENLQLEEPVKHGSMIVNRVSFAGRAVATLHGRAYRHDAESGKVEQLGIAPDAEVTFTDDNRLHFNSGLTSRTMWHVADFLSMMPRTNSKWGQPLPLRLESGMPLAQAMRQGVLLEGLVGRPVVAARMVYEALTVDRSSTYLTRLRKELRPAAVTDGYVDAARRTAIEQWQAVFRGERTVRPYAVGLRDVAACAQILS